MDFQAFVHQVRRWWVLDLVLAVLYIFYSRNDSDSGKVKAAAVALAVMYAIDSASLFYLTSPDNLMKAPKWKFHANVFVNVATLVVNIVYV